MSNFGKILKVPTGGRSRSEDQKKSVIAQKKRNHPLTFPLREGLALFLKIPKRIQGEFKC
ncbi:hypothetical protein CH380_06670 [Leptospira adleri]|uniref:Uncharacterized protein n=1 Tax=Leptospira adleri TaxID=2023186 RepID=A0A2M9YRN2_9LEPT|nr:hypothetical protein CH380_06670 [Leptospira adleri]PJZ62347.1 hypothetical protein CH376_08280 [Leptospira adleri]